MHFVRALSSLLYSSDTERLGGLDFELDREELLSLLVFPRFGVFEGVRELERAEKNSEEVRELEPEEASGGGGVSCL